MQIVDTYLAFIVVFLYLAHIVLLYKELEITEFIGIK